MRQNQRMLSGRVNARSDIDSFLKSEMLPGVKDLHAEPEDHHKIISRWLRALLKQAEDWSVSDCLSRFRMIKSQKCQPSGPALAIINDDQLIAPEDDLSIQMLGKLVSAHGGVRSHDAMMKKSDIEADYVRRQENGVNKKCTIIPLALIKSDLWISLCLKCGAEEWIHYADVDTPSGVEEVLESTRVSSSQHNSRPSVTSEISDISSASQIDNNSIFGDHHNTRQTPEEMAAALSQAVDDLDLSADADTQVWADQAAVDLSPNMTDKNLNHSIKSRSGVQIDVTPTNSVSAASLSRSESNTSSVKSTQSKGPFICEQCQRQCASKSGLKSHLRVHN